MKQYQIFFSLSHDLLCIVNEDGYFTKVNEAFSRNLEYSLSELYSMPFINMVYPEDKKATLEAFANVVADHVIKSFSNRYITKSNQVICLTWAAFKHNGLVYAIARNDTNTKYIEKVIQYRHR